MRETSAGLLEYAQLKALVGRYIASALGRELLDAIEPSTSKSALEAELAATREAIDYLNAASRPKSSATRIRFDGLPESPAPARKLAIEGASLDAKEILEVISLLERAAEARAMLAPATEYPRLAAIASVIGDFRAALREVSGKILPDGSVADHASVALNRIRRDKEKQRGAIQDSLERFMRAHRDDGILQDEFITIRNDRFVVPLVSGQRKKVGGVIHAASGSGHTLFVEPLETIDLNNDLVRLTEEEMREVHRILRELTARLRQHAPEIGATLDVMARLDLLFAKAQFGIDFECAIPRFGDRLMLRGARHPLLQDVLKRQRKAVVPVSFTLDTATRTLLISGPNTGGKTVAMKTAGLLSLMAQSALPVPATEAEFPIFDSVLADIGDQQSIEQSLSSFSAHIAHVREMLEAASPDSLIILDELGRATDPDEGGALAVAVIDRFREMGCFTMASTHLVAIKVYGANTKGVLNASMGFDDDTLQPTYLLRTGAPGRSAGLSIAGRLGIPEDLIARARASMSTQERDIAQYLEELHRRLDEVALLERTLIADRDALAKREQEFAAEMAKKESVKIKELERRTAELVDRFETEARQAIDSMQQKQAVEKAARTAAKVTREFERGVTQVLKPQSAPAVTGPKIEEGSRVRLREVREPARVRRVLQNGNLEVEAGFLKMQVQLADVLEVLPPAGAGARLPKNVRVETGPRWNITYSELNVIGQRAEEAVEAVDKFLDTAAMAEVDRVRIVHGHGMGVLKRSIGDLLKSHPHVARYYPAAAAEGGSGATIVELRIG